MMVTCSATGRSGDPMDPTCHHCGRPLPASPDEGGLCPACLWQMLPGESDTLMDGGRGFPEVEGHQILEELARGGMGIVYRALQLQPRREVALKMLIPVSSDRIDPLRARERFGVEIRALAELDHPDILPLYQVGESDGWPWFTMKLAVGGSLATRLRRQARPFTPRRAAALMADLADAVHFAHSHGVLHRDVKPGNILFDERDTGFLADFGLAKLMDSTEDMTRSGTVVGTWCYMAPEVASHGARATTVSSDVYGLGAVLYELLAGRPPFIAEGTAALVRQIVENAPDHPSTLVDHVPRDLELICLTCLAKEPRQRYASAGEMADDLRRWMRGEPIAARRAGLATRLWAWSRRRPALASLSGALVLTLLGSTVWLAWTHTHLNIALREAGESRARADAQSEFLLGKFAESLESMGRLDLIESACESAATLAPPVDKSGRKHSSRLNIRWGEIKWARGSSAEAAEKFRTAQRLADELVREDPGDVASLALGVTARTRRAEVAAEFTTFDEASALLDEAQTILERSESLPADEARRLRGEIHETRARILTRLRQGVDALADAGLATEEYRQWLAQQPDRTDRKLRLITALREEGLAAYNRVHSLHPERDGPRRQELLQRAFRLFREGQGMAESVIAVPPAPALARFELAQCAGNAGVTLGLTESDNDSDRQRIREEVRGLLELDHRVMTELVAQDPRNWRWQFKLSDSDLALADYWDTANEPERAGRHRQEQRKRLAAIAANISPEVREWRLAEMNAEAQAGSEALARGDLSLSRIRFDRARQIGLALVRRRPAQRTEQDGWRNLTWMISEAWKNAGHREEAVRVYVEAIEAAREGMAAGGEAASWWGWTGAALQRRFADLRLEANDVTGALEANHAALVERARLLRQRTLRAVEDPSATANSFKHTERLQLQLERYRDALETARASLALYKECREVAGPVLEWAIPLKAVLDECVKAGPPFEAPARALAAEAAAGFFPPQASPISGSSKAVAESLQSLAGGATPPVPTPP